MNKKYILSFDQGTSSSRAVLFNYEGQVVGIEQQEFKQYYPKAGWVEHDAEEIFDSQIKTAKKLLKKLRVSPSEIASIGITNQRETTVLWNKKTGKPLYNAIVWQDKRTAPICKKMIEDGLQNYVKSSTGLIIDSYFSASKINWIFNSVPAAKELAKEGNLLFGTIDTWLLWNLTGGKIHKTDYSNASRTMLYNIKKLDWDKKLIDYFNIPSNILPNVANSSEIYGESDKSIFGESIIIGGIAGDQQSALFGQACFDVGMAKNTYGTGCFMLLNTGDKIVESNSGLITTIAWGINNKVEYALEGSVFIAGAAIKWLRDSLKLINTPDETEKIAFDVVDTEEVYFVPAFSGLGAPYWDMDARGAILGITQGVTNKHIVRATLESLAYQSMDVIRAMQDDSGIQLKKLNVDGGASANNFLMQFQADILNTNVLRPQNIETTALGVAYLAGLAVGFWSRNDILEKRHVEKEFVPTMEKKQREKLYSGWLKAVDKAKGWQQ
ncbi:MAG: glycerol kinase GlpK [Bacteroidales bacterium]|jgi:glycerol kinase|nr:glycerol kinase GlpK [Bacteroidales bacterium]